MVQPGVDGAPDATTVEVHGRVVRAVWAATDGLAPGERRVTREALASASLADPDEARWYPLDSLRAALSEVGEAADTGVLRDLGRTVGTTFDRGDVDSVPGALAALDDSLHDTHRGDVGGNEFRQIGDADGRMECRAPYPCSFKRGVVLGIVDALGDGYACLNEVGTCRDDGGDRCTYELSW